MNLSTLSSNEKKELIREMAERVKDLVFMQAERIAEEWLTQCIERGINLDNKDAISLDYEVEMVGADIFQIVGRTRRRLTSRVEK